MPIKLSQKEKKAFETGLKLFPFVVSTAAVFLSGHSELVNIAVAKSSIDGIKAFHAILDYCGIIQVDEIEKFKYEIIENIEDSIKNHPMTTSDGSQILDEVISQIIIEVENESISLELSRIEFEGYFIDKFISIAKLHNSHYTPHEVRIYFNELGLSFFKTIEQNEEKFESFNIDLLGSKIIFLEKDIKIIKEKNDINSKKIDINSNNIEKNKQNILEINESIALLENEIKNPPNKQINVSPFSCFSRLELIQIIYQKDSEIKKLKKTLEYKFEEGERKDSLISNLIELDKNE